MKLLNPISLKIIKLSSTEIYDSHDLEKLQSSLDPFWAFDPSNELHQMVVGISVVLLQEFIVAWLPEKLLFSASAFQEFDQITSGEGQSFKERFQLFRRDPEILLNPGEELIVASLVVAAISVVKALSGDGPVSEEVGLNS